MAWTYEKIFYIYLAIWLLQREESDIFIKEIRNF